MPLGMFEAEVYLCVLNTESRFLAGMMELTFLFLF